MKTPDQCSIHGTFGDLRLLILFMLTVLLASCLNSPGPGSPNHLLKEIADPAINTSNLLVAVRALPAKGESARFWRDIANNSRYSLSHRRLALFQLFDRHFVPGMTVGDVGKMVGYPQWLKSNQVNMVAALGGWIPMMNGLREDNVGFFHVLVEEPNPKHYPSIYLRIRGRPIDPFDLFESLTNKKANPPVKRDLVLDIVSVEELSGTEVFNGFGISSNSRPSKFRGDK